MASLRSFSDSILPGDSFVESSGQIVTLPSKYTTNLVKLQAYPDINISREIYNSHISQQDNLIIPVQESLIKEFTRTFFDEGLKNSIEVLEKSESTIISSISKGILKIWNYGNRLKMFLNPYMKEIPVEQYENYSEVRNWKTASIRFIAFHPQCFRIAVASVDDSIRIFSNDKSSIITLLKNSQQKSIFSVAFRPYNFSIIAVGCQNGFLVWTIDPNSNMTRPLSQAVHFKHGNHSPVTSLEFNHNGNLLATASINDTSILIWDIDQNKCIPLRRFSIPFLKLQWSLDGAFVFTSTVANVFRVFDCEKWNSDRWTISNGIVQSFQWSPCAKFLLFVTSKDPVLYCLGFADEPLFNQSKQEVHPHRALPIADLSKVTIEHNECGGTAQQLTWNGKYLAISFKETNTIAIFQTTIRKHQLHILPMFFICGLGASEYPTFITFQPFYKNSSGSIDNVLTIGWSSGRLEFHPFI